MRKTQSLLICFPALALLACVASLPLANSFPRGKAQLGQSSPLSPPSLDKLEPTGTQILAGAVPTATTSLPVANLSHSTRTPLSIIALEDPVIAAGSVEQAMAAALNEERAAHNLPPLRIDEILGAVARAHAQDMVGRNYFAHTSPDGVTVSDRLTEAGLVPLRYGENLIYGVRSFQRPAQVALEWFMNSEPHRKNILHPAFTRVGVGAARLEDGSWAFVLDLAAEEVE